MDNKKKKILLIAIPTVIVLCMLATAKIMIGANHNSTSEKTNATDFTIKSEEREYQIKEAIRKAYVLWYQNDADSYEENTKIASQYFGKCFKKMLKENENEKVAKNIKEKGLSLTVKIKEIKIDCHTHKGLIKGVQTIKREKRQVRRNIYASFVFGNIPITEENSFGIQIDNWSIYNDDVIKD